MTKTRVVHVNSEEWSNTPEDQRVYIGRAVPRRGFSASFWANPERITADIDRDEAIARYEVHVEMSDWHRQRITELRGKVLGCWCKPEACHGDVLARLADLNDAEYEAWLAEES